METRFVFAVVFLLIGIIIIPTSAHNIELTFMQSSDGNILYVGGSGPNNYTTIQSAIDDAFGGDTVFVYDDSSPYIENLLIEKQISLIGEDKYTTIIDGDTVEDVIFVNSSRVTIDSFTIKNGGSHNDGIKIIENNNFNTISNNIICNNSNAIQVDGSSFIKIDNNLIFSNEGGIHLWWGSNNNQVSNNTIYDNVRGIMATFSNGNIITHNVVNNNRFYGLLTSGRRHIISYNEFNGNDEMGIALAGDIGLGNILVSHNEINNNGYRGGIEIFCFPWSPGINIRFRYNNITYNGGPGVYCFLVFFSSFRYNNIYGNDPNAQYCFCGRIVWDKNYWNAPGVWPIKIPWKIYGIELENQLPFCRFDWRPVQEPYDVGG